MKHSVSKSCILSDKDSEADSIKDNVKRSMKAKKFKTRNKNRIVSSDSDTSSDSSKLSKTATNTNKSDQSGDAKIKQKRRKRKMPTKESSPREEDTDRASHKKAKKITQKSRKNSSCSSTKSESTIKSDFHDNTLISPKKCWLKYTSVTNSEISDHSESSCKQEQIDASLNEHAMTPVTKLGLKTHIKKRGTLKRNSDLQNFKKVRSF